ncbi:MAG: RNA methyltransferase [Flavobacteriaceae bacterium]|nr:RNA methyltransferase [Flavobacteriaceae bacterium]
MVDLKLLEHLESYLTNRRQQRFLEVVSQRTKHLTVAIEDVYQKHNTSAVLRSCDIFGIQEVHIIEAENDLQIDREIALGAQKWVDLYHYPSADTCIDNLRNKGYRIIATTPHETEHKLEDFDISEPACIFLGRETEGLSEVIFDRADSHLNIPMYGFTESLNISVSAAIILQHLTSKLRKSEIAWQLTEEEQLEKRIDWSKKTIKSINSVLEHYYAHN